MNTYSRHDVLRILRIRATQLASWERAGLISRGEAYSFQELVQLRKLRDLQATPLSVSSIRASVHAMRAVSGMANPLLEAGAVRRGTRLLFRHSGAIMEPIARQFVFDFEAMTGDSQLAAVGQLALNPAALDARISILFIQAVQMEEANKPEAAAAIYEAILRLDSKHAPSCINLGTICYHKRAFKEAEDLYRRATVADDSYALAFFDLGNVLDEMQRLGEAIAAYREAIRLAPKYADAHYNLALAYERTGERRRALRHWAAYLKLDPVGAWANYARGQVKRILAREKLAIVHRSAGTLGLSRCTSSPSPQSR